MATTENTYTQADNSTVDRSFTFPYLDATDIKVSLDGNVTTAYSLHNATTIRLNSVPSNGTAIRIYRQTSDENLKATFYPGSAIKANDLNENALQNLYVIQETNNLVDTSWQTGDETIISTETWAGNDTRVATTGAIDGRIDVKIDTALTTDVVGGQSITVTDDSPSSGKITLSVTGNSIRTNELAADAVTGAELADDACDSEHYVDGSIDHVHLANDVIDGDNIQDDVINSEHIVGGAVDLEHMSANSVDSDQYVDGSIDRVHLAADIVDGTKIADDSINSEHYIDASIDHQHLANDVIDGDNIQDDVINSEHIVAGALDEEHYADGSITSAKLNAATVVVNSEQAAASVNDTSFFTTSASDARYFNISSGDTIKDGVTFPDNDTTIATTAAINDRIVDLVDDVGGFVAIANETSFPDANPDVNNGAGTIISIKALASNLVSNGSGVATISNGNVSSNATVTINGLDNSTTYNSTMGMLVETTSTLHTYTFHRLTPKATEITTVAASISNVNTVAGAISNVNSVASNESNINSAVSNASNINSAVSNASNINAVVSNASNINTVAGNNSNVTTVAGANSNISTVAGAISNVNTVAGSISDVNNFADLYQIGTSAPTQDGGGNSLSNGDLWYDSSANKALMIYDGSSGDGFSAATPTASVLQDIAIVSGQITFSEDLGGVADSLTTGTGNNINTVASAISNVNTVAGISANVTTVAGISSNVTSVAGAVSNINTTVSNLASINNFAEVYRIASSAPTSSLNEGDLWYDSTGNVLKYYNGSAWTVTAAAGLSNIDEDSTPELGGHLDCNNNNLTEVGTVSGDNLQIDFGSIA